MPKQAVCGRQWRLCSAGAARSSGAVWTAVKWTTNTWARGAMSGTRTRGATGGRGEEDCSRCVRVHCAAASATYGREALPRQRRQGIREKPHPMQSRAPCAGCCCAPVARGSEGRGAQAQLALCGQCARPRVSISDCTSEFGTIPVINQLGQQSLPQLIWRF